MDTQQSIIAVLITAGALGIFHTLIAPDHYLPFATLGKLRKWSLHKTLRTTFLCGLGHVLSSLAIGLTGVALGSSVGLLEKIDGSRSDVVKWLFLGFALAYLIYGIRRGFMARRGLSIIGRNEKCECPVCGFEHRYSPHVHGKIKTNSDSINFWALFIIFTLGPCEILIPLIMYPASKFDWLGVVGVALVFSICTVATMLVSVGLLYFGFKKINLEGIKDWGHAITGVVLSACALLMFSGL